MFTWSIPDPDLRRACLPVVFAAFAHLYLPYEETYLTQDGAGAEAVLAPRVGGTLLSKDRAHHGGDERLGVAEVWS